MVTKFKGAVQFPGGGAAVQHQRYTISHTDFDAAATSTTVDLATDLPAGLVVGHSFRVDTAFAAPTLSAAVLSVGISGGNTDQYIDGVNVFATAAYQYTPGDGTAPVPQAATTLSATLALTDDNTEDTTAGEAIVDIWYIAPAVDPDPV